MRRRWLITAALLCALIGWGLTSAAQTADVSLEFGNRHTFWLSGEPKLDAVPNTAVYYYDSAPDFDLYRFGEAHYVNNGSTWYRSDLIRGPYVRVDFNQVPREVTVVPVDYRNYEIQPEGEDPWSSRWK